MGTQVITRDTGRRLGVVGEVVVDIDRREVVALGLRDNPLTRFLPGLPRWMPLESIRQVGDVILVDSADSLSEAFNPERYSKVINCQVITESGEQLGRVLGFSFDIETGELTTLVIGAIGVPLLGEGVLSTWELAVGEIVSSGTDRIIVYEGAEEKLKQLGTGLLEKLGIGGSSWEREERERYRSGVIPAENQLPAGQPSTIEQRRIQPATSRAVEPQRELDYVELDERREREPLRQRLYLDEEERSRPDLSRGRYDDDLPAGYRDSWDEPRARPSLEDRQQPGPSGDRGASEERSDWGARSSAGRESRERFPGRAPVDRFEDDRRDERPRLRDERAPLELDRRSRPDLSDPEWTRDQQADPRAWQPQGSEGRRTDSAAMEPRSERQQPSAPQARGPEDPWTPSKPRTAQRPRADAEPIDVEPENFTDPW